MISIATSTVSRTGFRVMVLVACVLLAACPQVHAQAPSGSVGAVTAAPPSAEPEAPPPVQIRTWTSRTAVWVGDRVTYTVDVTCAPDVDIVTDDLARERLKLNGLELISAESQRTTLASGGLSYRFTYQLATFEVESPTLQIDHLPVRYYVKEPGRRSQDAAPSGETTARGALIARRSTIPDSLPRFGVRDERAAADLPATLALARPVGTGLLLVSAAPVGLLVVSLVWRHRPRRVRRRRHARALTQAALNDLRGLDVSPPSQRREAYSRLDAALRQHIAGLTGIPAESLTAAEVTPRLHGHGQGLPVEAVAALLAECERARYAPPDHRPTSEQFQDALNRTAELIPPPRGLKRLMPSLSFRR